jgi:hypothetical protein
MCNRIELEVQDATGAAPRTFEIGTLVIAGWTGRDVAGLEAHIRELEELGIARPKAVPMFYRVDAALLTTAPTVQMVGRAGSGEVESVLFKQDGELFIGVGSDHTDRELEAVGITLSKQVCGKPIGATVWRWSEVAEHWDRISLRSRLPVTGESYQEGETTALRRPDELLALYEDRYGPLPDGSAMFCGTLPAHGGIRFAEAMALELHDPVLERAITHQYAVDVLPIVEA